MIRGVGGVGVWHDGRTSRLSGLRVEGRHTRCAVDPEIPGIFGGEPRMAWTVQEVIESCIKDRLTASLCPVAGFAGQSRSCADEGWIDGQCFRENPPWRLPGSKFSSSERNVPGRQC